MPVDWSEIEGQRLGLMLVASNEEEGGGVLSGPVVRVERGFAVGRSSAPPFPLLPEWANRARRLADVREADVRSIIGRRLLPLAFCRRHRRRERGSSGHRPQLERLRRCTLLEAVHLTRSI